MKTTLRSLLIISGICLSSLSYAIVEGERYLQSEEAVMFASYGHIDAKGLKGLIDSHVDFVLLDARGHKWHDENIIPGALLASYEYTPEELALLIPDTDKLIVVYCFSFTCPLSPRLADKLVEMGYKNVVEYPGGLKEWRNIANYPVDNIQ